MDCAHRCGPFVPELGAEVEVARLVSVNKDNIPQSWPLSSTSGNEGVQGMPKATTYMCIDQSGISVCVGGDRVGLSLRTSALCVLGSRPVSTARGHGAHPPEASLPADPTRSLLNSE